MKCQLDHIFCLDECLIEKHAEACYKLVEIYAKPYEVERQLLKGSLSSLDRLGYLAERVKFFSELTCLYGKVDMCLHVLQASIKQIREFINKQVKCKSYKVWYIADLIRDIEEAKNIYCSKESWGFCADREYLSELNRLVKAAKQILLKRCGLDTLKIDGGLGKPIPEDIERYIKKFRQKTLP